MMRRYDDPVEVRRGTVQEADGPEQFLWRGRLWKVRSVLAHWVENGSRRRSDDVGLQAELLRRERELWRVRAGRGGLEADGVFDLSFDGHDGSWQLVGCEDRSR